MGVELARLPQKTTHKQAGGMRYIYNKSLWLLRVAILACVAFAAPFAYAQEFSGLARVNAARSQISDGWRGVVNLDLGLTQGVPWRVFTLTRPDRLVIDFKEVDWTGLTQDQFLNGKGVTAVRFGSFRPGWSRLVADLAAPMAVTQAGMAVNAESGAAQLSMQLAKVDRAAFDASAGAPHDPRWDLPPAAKVARPKARPGSVDTLRVVIDAGHGGIDPGAQEGGIKEADLMLTLARELREALLRAGGFEVVMTRNADEFVSLEGRVATAHQAGADLFLSLHADSLSVGKAQGATVYTLDEMATDEADQALAERHNREDLLAGLDLTGADDVVAGVLFDLARQETAPRAEALAQYVLSGIENATGAVNTRPLRKASFSVLKAADIPSILIEAGFLSTSQDRKNLSDPFWRAGFVAGVRDGIQAWAISDASIADLRRK